MSLTFTRLTDVETVDSLSEDANVLVEQEGEIKRVSNEIFSMNNSVQKNNGVVIVYLKWDADGFGYHIYSDATCETEYLFSDFEDIYRNNFVRISFPDDDTSVDMLDAFPLLLYGGIFWDKYHFAFVGWDTDKDIPLSYTTVLKKVYVIPKTE